MTRTQTLPALPTRDGPRPRTMQSMPHMQIGVEPDPAIKAELERRAFSLPDIEDRPTVVSIPGARALWLREGVPVAHPELIVAGREFDHIHPDASLHVMLPPDRAGEAVERGWAEPHPLAALIGNGGMVLLYTPRDPAELEVIWRLIVESYNFVVGRTEDPGAYARRAISAG